MKNNPIINLIIGKEGGGKKKERACKVWNLGDNLGGCEAISVTDKSGFIMPFRGKFLSHFIKNSPEYWPKSECFGWKHFWSQRCIFLFFGCLSLLQVMSLGVQWADIVKIPPHHGERHFFESLAVIWEHWTPQQDFNAPWDGKSPWNPDAEKTSATCRISLPLRWQVDPGPWCFSVPEMSLAHPIQTCQTHRCAPLCCRDSPVQD